MYCAGVYQSVRTSLGYYVDITCDGIGGVFLMFGVLFYLFKRFDPTKQSELPWKSPEKPSSGKDTFCVLHDQFFIIVVIFFNVSCLLLYILFVTHNSSLHYEGNFRFISCIACTSIDIDHQKSV